jgi:phosphoesterase RecJ-like protein
MPDLLNFKARLSSAGCVAIISHIRPDGDAFGATLALGLALLQSGKAVAFLSPSDIPARYVPLLDGVKFQKPETLDPTQMDMVIAVDCAHPRELGEHAAGWKIDVNIDHHRANGRYGVLNLVETGYPATCAYMADFLKDHFDPDITITPAIASALYLGIIADTGNFRYEGTSAATFEAAARLVSAGANPATLSSLEFQVPPETFRQGQELLSQIEYLADGRLAVLQISDAQFRSLTGDTVMLKEYVLEQMNLIEGVEIVAFLRWIDPTTLAGSLRARGPHDVDAFARKFGGGGHRLAAGLCVYQAAPGVAADIIRGLEDLLVSC